MMLVPTYMSLSSSGKAQTASETSKGAAGFHTPRGTFGVASVFRQGYNRDPHDNSSFTNG